jgi:hypothetical protein
LICSNFRAIIGFSICGIVPGFIPRLDFEAQSLWVRIGQAIAVASILNFVAVATDIKPRLRFRRKRRNRAGRIQFQASIELQSCLSLTLTREFHRRASRRRATYHMLATPSARADFKAVGI